MSDALTDLSRDDRRAASYEDFLEGLARYLKKPSAANYNLVRELAEKTDNVPLGYWGGRTALTEKLQENLEKFRRGDKKEWGRLLWGIERSRSYPALKELSPFKGMSLLKVDYGSSFVNIKVEGLDDIIGERDFMAEDCDDYIIAVPEEVLKNSDITWIRCGISGVKGPRDKKGKKK